MSAINQIWSAVAIFLLYYSLNTLARVQWTFKAGIISFIDPLFGNSDITRESFLLIGIPVITIATFVAISISFIYYKESSKLGKVWHKRVPRFLNLDVPNSLSKDWAVLSLSLIFIPYCINLQQFYLFLVKDIKAFQSSGLSVSIWHPTWPTILFTDEYRYGSSNGFTFWPLYMPLLYLIIEIFLMFYILKYLRKLFSRK